MATGYTHEEVWKDVGLATTDEVDRGGLPYRSIEIRWATLP